MVRRLLWITSRLVTRPLPAWATVALVVALVAQPAVSAVVTTMYASLSVPSTGTINDTNATASRCAGYDASKNIKSATACVDSAGNGLSLSGTSLGITAPVSVANGGTNITSLLGTRCIRSVSTTAFGEAAGDCVTNVTAGAPLASSGGTTPNLTLGTVPIANGGTNLTTATTGCFGYNGTAYGHTNCGDIAGNGLSFSGTTFSLVAPVSVANGGTNSTSFTNPSCIRYNGTALASGSQDCALIYSSAGLLANTPKVVADETTLTLSSGCPAGPGTFCGTVAVTFPITFSVAPRCFTGESENSGFESLFIHPSAVSTTQLTIEVDNLGPVISNGATPKLNYLCIGRA